MSVDKTWVAVCRRAPGEQPLPHCYDFFLAAVVGDEDVGGGEEHPLRGVLLPHTVVYRSGDDYRWYYHSDRHKCVQLKAPDATTPDAIRRALLQPRAAAGPAAVWLSEREDSKGWLVTQEFLDDAALSAFLARRGDRGRCGVLQSFVAPKPFRGRSGVNHELVVTWTHPATLRVERRFNKRRMGQDPADPASAQCACVHPAVAVVGRLAPPPDAATAPFQPADVSAAAEDVAAPQLVAVLHPLVAALRHRVGAALTAAGVAAAAERHDALLRQMLLTLKLDEQGHLWLLGLMALRGAAHADAAAAAAEGEADLVTRRPDFELLRLPRRSASPPSRAKLEAAALSALGDQEDAEPADFSAPVDDFDAGGSGPLYGGGGGRGRPATSRTPYTGGAPHNAQRAASARAPRSAAELDPVMQRARTVFVCPNCGEECERKDVHTTTYRCVVRWYRRQSRAKRAAVTDALSPQRHGAHGRPTTPEFLEHPEEPFLSSRTDGEYVALPPVLQRLAVPLDELRRRDVWLDRQVNICQECYYLFYDASDEADQLKRSRQKERDARDAWADRKMWHTEGYRPVTSDELEYPLAREMVFTDLQRHHRRIQRKVRLKQWQQRAMHRQMEQTAPAAARRPADAASSPDDDAAVSPVTPPAPGLRAGARVPAPPRRAADAAASGGRSPPSGPPAHQLPRFLRPRFGALSQAARGDDADTTAPLSAAAAEADAEAAARKDIESLFRGCEPGQAKDTEMESTVSTVFCNQLYQEMAVKLEFGRPVEDADGDGQVDRGANRGDHREDVPEEHQLFVVYGHNRNRLPLPHQRIDITIPLDDPRRVAEKEKASGLTKNRDRVFGLLSELLPIFQDLNPEECELLLSTVADAVAKEREKERQEQAQRHDKAPGRGPADHASV